MNESLHELFNRNPFLGTRIFDTRAKSFIKNMLMKTGDTGLNVKNYCYRIEFQAQGMPHIHRVFWLENESIEKYLFSENEFEFDPQESPKFIDKIISCSTNTKDNILNTIVKEVQVNYHTNSCRKGQKKSL